MNLCPTPHAQQRMTMRGIGAANIQAVLRDGELKAHNDKGAAIVALYGLHVVAVIRPTETVIVTAFWSQRERVACRKERISRGATRKEARRMGSRQYYRGVSKS